MIRQKIFSRQILSFLLLLLFVGGSADWSLAAEQTPEEAAKSFYQWYLRQLNAEKSPIDQKQMILKSVSKSLGKWIYSPAYEEYGADYFIDAQDFDENWSVKTSKAVIKGNNATLKVMLAAPTGKKSLFKQNLAVKMLKENGGWKIAAVNNRKLTD